MEKYYIQQQHDLNFQHFFYHYCVSTLDHIYSSEQEKYQTFYVRSSWFKKNFNWQQQKINIADVYVSIKCNSHKFIDYSIYKSNWQHLMLVFKRKTNFLQIKWQGILPTNMLASLEINNSFVLHTFMDDIFNKICHLH